MPVKEKPIFNDFFNLDDRAMGVIADRYGISDIDCFLPILLDGEVCTLLEVRSATSKKVIVEAGHGLYFLKQIPWYCDTPDQVTSSTSIQQQLREAGCPLPRILSTTDGKLWTSIDSSVFVLFEFATGRRYVASREQLASSARTLAGMHCQEVVVPTAPREDLFQLVRNHIDLLADTAAKLGWEAHEVIEVFTAQLDDSAADAQMLGWADLPFVAVHGDYNPWNLLFDTSGEVSAVLDFDNCDIGQRLHDIAEAIITHCIISYRADSTNFAAEQPVNLDLTAIRYYVAAYESVSPLTPTEAACLPHIIRVVYIELISLGLIRRDLTLNEGLHAVARISSLPALWGRFDH